MKSNISYISIYIYITSALAMVLEWLCLTPKNPQASPTVHVAQGWRSVAPWSGWENPAMSCGSAAELIIQKMELVEIFEKEGLRFACFVLCLLCLFVCCFQLIFNERGRQIIPVLLMVKRLMDVINMCRYLNKQIRYLHITSRGNCLTPQCWSVHHAIKWGVLYDSWTKFSELIEWFWDG